MPIYEFECEDGHVTEILCRSHETADAVLGYPCGTCQKPVKKRRTFPSRVGISFKGDGFYKNDYSKGGEDVKKNEA